MVNIHMNGKFSHLKNVIMSDKVPTLKATIMNPNIFTNVKTGRNPVSMATTAGTKKLTLEVTVKGLGHVC